MEKKSEDLSESAYLDDVLFLDVGVGVADGSSVVGDDVGDLVLSGGLPLYGAELEAGLAGVDLVGLVASLGVVEDSEVLSGLLNANNVHDAEREAGVSPDFVVNLDQSFLILNDLYGFLSAERVPQSVSEEDAQGDAFSSLVGPGRGSRCPDAAKLVKHPVGGSCHSLLMLLRSTRLHTKVSHSFTGRKLSLPFSLLRYILIINS